MNIKTNRSSFFNNYNFSKLCLLPWARIYINNFKIMNSLLMVQLFLLLKFRQLYFKLVNVSVGVFKFVEPQFMEVNFLLRF